jgi:predicted NAD/FAD-binding protein
MGYGFHEDGLKAGRAAANGILTLIHQQQAA